MWYTCDGEIVFFLVFPYPYLHAIDSKPLSHCLRVREWCDRIKSKTKKCLWVVICVIQALGGLERIWSMAKVFGRKGLRRMGSPWKTSNTCLHWDQKRGEWKVGEQRQGWVLLSSPTLYLRKAASLGERMAVWCGPTELSRSWIGPQAAGSCWTQMGCVNRKEAQMYQYQ